MEVRFDPSVMVHVGTLAPLTSQFFNNYFSTTSEILRNWCSCTMEERDTKEGFFFFADFFTFLEVSTPFKVSGLTALLFH